LALLALEEVVEDVMLFRFFSTERMLANVFTVFTRDNRLSACAKEASRLLDDEAQSHFPCTYVLYESEAHKTRMNSPSILRVYASRAK
jgi:hypothetical protein